VVFLDGGDTCYIGKLRDGTRLLVLLEKRVGEDVNSDVESD